MKTALRSHYLALHLDKIFLFKKIALKVLKRTKIPGEKVDLNISSSRQFKAAMPSLAKLTFPRLAGAARHANGLTVKITCSNTEANSPESLQILVFISGVDGN